MKRCKKCNSTDLWRVPERRGFIAWIMRIREQKPYQCRSCRRIFYHPIAFLRRFREE
jgi:hypothetical protein